MFKITFANLPNGTYVHTVFAAAKLSHSILAIAMNTDQATERWEGKSLLRLELGGIGSLSFGRAYSNAMSQDVRVVAAQFNNTSSQHSAG